LNIAWHFVQLASFDAVRQAMDKVPFVEQVYRNTEMSRQLEVQIVPGFERESNGIISAAKIALQLSDLVEIKVETTSKFL
jgi:hypothetical protein